jgi:hypothetical protein
MLVDQPGFRAIARSISETPSRREVLRGLAGVGLGMLHIPEFADAKKKRKRKKRKPKATPNSYGCLEVDDPCKSAEQCCSGVCEGKKGKKWCLAHGIGSCDQTAQGFCLGDPVQAPCGNSPHCVCTKTTAGSNFCGSRLPPSNRAECKKDADCETQGYPPGSACALWANGFCTGDCSSGMACMAPCGSEPPDPQD